MRHVLMGALCVVFLGGCGATSTIKLENGLLIEEAGQTNLFRPSLSVMQVSKCQEQEGVTTVIDIDGNSHTCYGKYVPVATVQGTQAGSMTGLGGAMIQGGAIVGGAYLLGDGIRDSGDTTTNNNNNDTESNGGQTINSNANLNQASSSSKAFSRSSSSSSANGGSVSMPSKHRMR